MEYIIIGIVILALAAGYYFYNKKKKDKKEDGGGDSTDLIKGSHTHFLINKLRAMNLFADKFSPAEKDSIVQQIRNYGGNALYLYTVDEGDGPSFNPYPVGFKDANWGNIDPDANKMAWWNQLINKWNMKTIIWLLPDDCPTLYNKPLPVLKKYISDMVKNFDANKNVGGYVLWLEMDEWIMSSNATGKDVTELLSHLKSITNKPVGIHLSPEVHKQPFWKNIIGSADYFFMQYGFGKSPEFIERETRQAIASLGNKVIAAEYSFGMSASDRALGQAAIRGGALGTGNGK